MCSTKCATRLYTCRIIVIIIERVKVIIYCAGVPRNMVAVFSGCYGRYRLYFTYDLCAN
jgi:hypothetical protein